MSESKPWEVTPYSVTVGDRACRIRAAEAEVVRAAEAYADAVEEWERTERYACKGDTIVKRHSRLAETALALSAAVAALRRERETAS